MSRRAKTKLVQQHYQKTKNFIKCVLFAHLKFLSKSISGPKTRQNVPAEVKQTEQLNKGILTVNIFIAYK